MSDYVLLFRFVAVAWQFGVDFPLFTEQRD